jgi:hypothetical protein
MQEGRLPAVDYRAILEQEIARVIARQESAPQDSSAKSGTTEPLGPVSFRVRSGVSARILPADDGCSHARAETHLASTDVSCGRL